MRIILVEDNESLAKGIAYRMEDAGHAVDILHDGLAADAYLRSDGGEVVILDKDRLIDAALNDQAH